MTSERNHIVINNDTKHCTFTRGLSLTSTLLVSYRYMRRPSFQTRWNLWQCNEIIFIGIFIVTSQQRAVLRVHRTFNSCRRKFMKFINDDGDLWRVRSRRRRERLLDERQSSVREVALWRRRTVSVSKHCTTQRRCGKGWRIRHASVPPWIVAQQPLYSAPSAT